MGKLDALSPLRVLERGYTLVKECRDGAPGGVVKSAAQVVSGEELEITFHDGKRIVQAR
jgi:exodeoxyribonuclease VII large subunit